MIGDRLYQVNAAHGLHESDYTPERWDLFDVGGDDAVALELFDALAGAATTTWACWFRACRCAATLTVCTA